MTDNPLAALIAGVPRRYDIDPVFNYLREDLVLAALEAAPALQDAWDKIEEHIDYAYRRDNA